MSTGRMLESEVTAHDATQRRLDALEAENERLRGLLNAEVDKVLGYIAGVEGLNATIERLRAELATALNDALEVAAKVCDKLAQNIYDECGVTDQETGERMIPTRVMDTVEAYEECAEAIRAIKREGGGNG